jgi:hypothetical protein
LAAAFLALAVGACEPYEFQLAGDHPLSGQILSHLGTVDPHSTDVALHEGGEVRLSNFGITEYTLTLGLNVLKGEGAEILIHPKVEVSTIKDSGIVARITTHGSSLTSHGSVLADRPEISVDTNRLIPVQILSEAHLLQVIVGCDTLYRGKSYTIESDDIVIKTLPRSEAEVVAPNWNYVPDLVRR